MPHTLSADDMNWTDMLVLLANEAGMSQVSLENVHALNATERRKLVAGNPVSVLAISLTGSPCL